MCLSTVYKVKNGEREKVCEYVSAVRAEDGKIYLTDVMGNETVVEASLQSMDFIKNVIILV